VNITFASWILNPFNYLIIKYVMIKKLVHKQLFKGLLLFLFFSLGANAQILSWDASTLSGGTGNFGPSPWSPETIDANITTSGLIRGSSIATGQQTAPSGAWGGAGGWSNTGATTDNNSFHFTVVAETGYKVSLSTITSATRKSNTGPTGYTLYYSVNGGTYISAGTATTTATSGSGSANTISLSSITALQNVGAGVVIKFRITPTGATTGNYYLTSANALKVIGTVTAVATAPTVANATGNKVYTAAGTFNISSVVTNGGTITGYNATGLPAGATVNTTSGVITFPANTVNAGTYTITISATNAAGTGTGTLTYTVNKGTQTISGFGTGGITKIVNDENFSLAATATSGLAVTYTSSNPAVATISATGEVDVLSVGTTTLTASQGGNANFNAATAVTRTLTVNPAPSLSVTPASVTGLDYVLGGGPSAPVQLTDIAGSNLNSASGSITISTTSDFEVSTQSNTGFGASTTYGYSSANFNNANPAIYVRLKSGLSIGEYTGTVTLTGGGATTSFTVAGEVEEAATVLTTTASYGPYCFGTSNTIQVTYTPQGTFDTVNGDFYVQRSDANGAFPNTFLNIIGFPNGETTNTREATLPSNLAAGNYRVRIIYFNGMGNVFVASTNDNGNNIVINALPTLTGVTQAATVCNGDNATITLGGLLPNTQFTVDYTINNVTGQMTGITSDAEGNASMSIPVVSANNGQQFVVTALTAASSCTKSFTTGNAATLSINPIATIGTIEANDVCAGQSTVISLTGLLANSASDITYNLNGGSSALAANVVANGAGNAQFEITQPAGSYTLTVTSILRTDSTPNCANSVTDISTEFAVNARPTAEIVADDSTLCLGANTTIDVELTGTAPFTLTYSVNGVNQEPVTIASRDITNNVYALNVVPATAGNNTYTITALTDANCTATTADISGSVIVAATANTFTGTVDSDWFKAGNWSCGEVPTEDIYAIIGAGKSAVVTGTASAASLTVEAGAALTVNSGSNLEVTDKIEVAANGTVTVQNNGNLLQVNDVDNEGEITVRRDSSPLFRQDYTMWSSPVAGQNLFSFSDGTLPNRFYVYDTANNAIANSTTGLINIANDFEVGKGYLIRMPNDGSPAYDNIEETMVYNGTFIGEPNNGTIPVTLSGAGSGFNLIGNPYPSPIRITDFFAANNAGGTNKLEGTIWIWRKKNNPNNNSSYITINSAGIYTGNNQPNTTTDPQGIIRTGQGFIVKPLTLGGPTTIEFNNAMRSTNTSNTFFRTNDNALPESHGIWLNLTSENGVFSQMYTGYIAGATSGFDNGLDSRFINDSKTVLASVIDNEEYVIQGRALPFSAQNTEALQLRTDVAGTYTITLDHVSGLFAQDQDIYIKDNVTGTVNDLRAGGYTFATEAGTFPGRFEVVYANESLGTNNPVLTANNVVVYNSNNVLTVNSGDVDMEAITIYDVRGREIYSKTGINAGQAVLTDLQPQQQVLIVQIATVNGKVSKKVVY
jgi:hypothetical protein